MITNNTLEEVILNNKTLVNKIKYILSKKHMTQSHLSQQIGVSASNISRFLDLQAILIKKSMIRKIESVLQIPLLDENDSIITDKETNSEFKVLVDEDSSAEDYKEPNEELIALQKTIDSLMKLNSELSIENLKLKKENRELLRRLNKN